MHELRYRNYQKLLQKELDLKNDDHDDYDARDNEFFYHKAWFGWFTTRGWNE